MKFKNAAFAGQKLSSEWGVITADENGVIEVDGEAAETFQALPGWKSVESAPAAAKEAVEPEAPVEEAPKAEVKEVKPEVKPEAPKEESKVKKWVRSL